MVAPTPYFSDRGCHVRIYEEALSLTRRGHDVCIVTYHLGRDMPGVRVVRIPNVSWYRKLEAGPSWYKPFLDILLLLEVFTEIRKFCPHIIHAHLHEGAFLGSILKKIFKVPLLFDYQGSLSGESLNHGFIREGSILTMIFKGLERHIDSCADFIVASSAKGRQELIVDWDVPPEKVTDLIDGVDTDVFKMYSKSDARIELEIPSDVKLVVYLGLFNRYQGVDLLLDVISIVNEKAKDIRFLLMGFPDTSYREKARRMGIDRAITFTGRVNYDRAPLLLSAGDLAVSPKLAKTEANGKLFNYMACGLPTVVFDNQVNQEILGEDGIYVEHGNVQEFADTIIRSVYDTERMTEKSSQLRARAVNSHSWNIRAIELEGVYRRMLESTS